MSRCIPDDLPYDIEEAANDWRFTVLYLVAGVDNLFARRPAEIPLRIAIDSVDVFCQRGLEGKVDNYIRLGRDAKQIVATRDFFRDMLTREGEGDLAEDELDGRIMYLRDLLVPVIQDDERYVAAHRKEYSTVRATLQRMADFGHAVGESVRYRKLIADDEDD